MIEDVVWTVKNPRTGTQEPVDLFAKYWYPVLEDHEVQQLTAAESAAVYEALERQLQDRMEGR